MDGIGHKRKALVEGSENTDPNQKITSKEKLYNAGYKHLNTNNFPQAIQAFGKAAQKGHVAAALMAGQIILRETTDEDTKVQAIAYFKMGLGKSGGGAEYLLATTTGTTEEDGFNYLRQAVRAGYAQAQNDLGELYYRGEGEIDQDYEAAFQLFQKAADQDITTAKYYLGRMLLKGEGCEKSLEEGLKLLKSIAAIDLDAVDLLASVYLEGKYGVAKHQELGEEYLETGCLNNSQWALDYRRAHQQVRQQRNVEPSLRIAVLKRQFMRNHGLNSI